MPKTKSKVFPFDPGRAIVVLLVVLGAALAAVNVWFRYSATGQIHEQWGTKAMLRIAESPQAELWELAEAPDASAMSVEDDDIAIGNRTYRIHKRSDLTRARGFVHLRNSLGQDASYAFACDLAPPNEWRWAIAFFDGDRASRDARTVVLFDADVRWAALAVPIGEANAVELSDKTAAGIKIFLNEQGANERRE
jgi:hypothetical protein